MSFWTKRQAEELVGKVVATNAGERVLIVGTVCQGANEYSVIGADGYLYAASDKNGLYCWEA